MIAKEHVNGLLVWVKDAAMYEQANCKITNCSYSYSCQGGLFHNTTIMTVDTISNTIELCLLASSKVVFCITLGALVSIVALHFQLQATRMVM